MSHGSHIIVIEPEYLIALDIEHTLRSSGYTNIQIFTSISEGVAYIRSNYIKLAIVSCALNNADCVETAQILSEKCIPFLILSGSEKSDAHLIFAKGVWIGKPHSDEALVGAVNAVLLEGDLGMTNTTERRKKGPPAIGDFDTAKRAAEEVLTKQREADRLKTERLRAARLSAGAPNHPDNS
jgi:DNA-binding response OmpR family regulator